MFKDTEFLLSGQQFLRLHEKVIGEVSKKYGMSRTEVSILLFLANNPQCDTAREIVECRMLTKSCVSKAIDSLVKQGMVVTREDQMDRRLLHLKIQEKADGVISTGLKAQRDMVETICQGITAEEMETLQKASKKMLENIREALKSCGKN